MGRYRRLRQIERLDPARDHERIFWLLTQYEFPWDYLQGVSVAFLRDFGVPRISQLLDRTQEFEKAGRKRYDDTVLIAYEMARDGMDSDHGRAAARHLNRIHHRYRIANEDYLYVLATTVVGPKRWIDRYGWRPLVPAEVESLARVGHRMGELMGIAGIPDDYAGFEQLHDAYEQQKFAYDPANHRVATATLRTATAPYPRPVRPLVARFSLAVLDEPLLDALGLPHQPRLLRTAAHRALRARARLVRCMPPRPDRRPYRQKPRSYPFGWTLDDLGPRWAHDRPLRPLPDENEPRTAPSAAPSAQPHTEPSAEPHTEPTAQPHTPAITDTQRPGTPTADTPATTDTPQEQ